MLARKGILVVEDNAINRAMLRELLSSEYDVWEAENGREALAVLEERKEAVSLILLDIVMPVMDGYTFLSIVKADASLAAIPVIVTTQSDSEADEVAALSHGASDFVAKPYKPQIILHRVASIIHLRETAAMVNQFQHDQLTGLYSKAYFYQCVRETLWKDPEQHYDIVCSDIENFKLINDVFGTAAGDRLLRGIAGLYRRAVGSAGICGRMGADQFACLVRREGAYTDEMFVRFGRAVNALPNAKSVVMKWGVYAVEDHGVSVEQMCDRALLAARSIKGQYGKHFAAYDDHLRNALLRQQMIIDGMESALADGQFLVYLQPKYQIRGNRLAGAEALVRWRHPEWGFLSPGEFIPLFEKNGFITKLDQFVWDRTCAYLREWDDKGYPPISVSVNVSRADIYNADITHILMRTVEKYGLPPSRLHLEITESAYTENPGQIIETVSRLRQLGFVMEMDDFGNGYSSLNMLNQMPIDVLKLDMGFIQSETAKPLSRGVLQFIMELARWMHLSVVAEGVETKEQLERLTEIGCDYVQGYYFAKPMPSDEFEVLLREQAVPEREEADGAAPRRESERGGQVLLVADEDGAYRRRVRAGLGDRFEIAEAATAEEAARLAAAERGRLAAVLLSLTLPEGQGLALLDGLRRDPSTWSTPVIATGGPDAALEASAIARGAADYAHKPHDQEVLRHRVLRAVRLASFQKREQALQEAAYRDHMTGVYNRRGWETALTALCREDAPCAFYLFDIDDFKAVNDTLGHMEGDRLIRAFGKILRAHTRKTDAVARFGGDEFIAVLKQMKSGAAAVEKGEEICRALSQVRFEEGRTFTVSVGIALWNGEEPLDTVIKRVDLALYHAKHHCKGGCCLWRE